MTRALFATIWVALVLMGCGGQEPARDDELAVQLNWFHDPTFAGEYIFAQNSDLDVSLRIGGPNVFPIGEVKSGRADVAIMGADIFLQAIAEDYSQDGSSDLLAIFVDFQRNPVGWVMHPAAVRALGLTDEERAQMSERDLNAWFFERAGAGEIIVGDKRGTETTAVWSAWIAARAVPFRVDLLPVGFDSGIVLEASNLAYPIYLNEEPYRLAERIGEDLVVFDPFADGVRAYGNVLVTTSQFRFEHPEQISLIQHHLSEAWQTAINDPEAAASLVGTYYTDVSSGTLQRQMDRTLEFVTFGGAVPGEMSAEAWLATLHELQAAGAVSPQLTDEQVLRNVVFQQ